MPVRALYLQDVGKNSKVCFFIKENTETRVYGIEIFLRTLRELLEYSWNSSTNPEFVYEKEAEVNSDLMTL